MASTTKLQKAGRDFLMRLIAQHGFAGAARVLRALADELEAIGVFGDDDLGRLTTTILAG